MPGRHKVFPHQGVISRPGRATPAYGSAAASLMQNRTCSCPPVILDQRGRRAPNGSEWLRRRGGADPGSIAGGGERMHLAANRNETPREPGRASPILHPPISTPTPYPNHILTTTFHPPIPPSPSLSSPLLFSPFHATSSPSL